MVIRDCGLEAGPIPGLKTAGRYYIFVYVPLGAKGSLTSRIDAAWDGGGSHLFPARPLRCPVRTLGQNRNGSVAKCEIGEK